MSRRALEQSLSLFPYVVLLSNLDENRRWNAANWKPSVRQAKYPQVNHRRIYAKLLLCALATLLSFAALAEGQVNPGTPSFSAYDRDQYDTVNLQNLNVSLNVPVMSKSGAFPFNASLVGGDSYFSYNGSTLQPGILAQPITPNINGILSPFGYTQVLASTTSSVTCPSGDGTGSATRYSGWYLQMTDGTVHSLPLADAVYGGASCTTTLTDQVIDGSGWTVTVVGGTYNAYAQTGVTVVSSGGLTIDIATATIQDAQSTPNKISYSSQEFFDTLGTIVMVVGANAPGQLNWLDVNGGNPTESQTLTSATLKTSFGCSGKADYPATSYFAGVTTKIEFPDSTNLGLAWEPNQVTSTDYTGRLSQITLRDGSSTVKFNYNPSNLGASSNYNLNCTNLVPNSMTRTTSDGTVSYTWAATVSGNTTTRVDIGGNKTKFTFSGGVLTEVQAYVNTGTVASPTYSSTATRDDLYCYNGNASNCATALVSVPVTEADVYTNIGVSAGTSRTQTQYDGGATGPCGSGSGSCYGNVTYSAQYDFGATSPATSTAIVYGSDSSGTCVAVSSTVHNKPCTIQKYSGSNLVAESKFTYDSHGNLLRQQVSTNGSAYISNSTNNVYNSNGTPSKTYDLANNETDYTYATGNYSDGCSGSSYNVFPTNITNVTTGINTSAFYDCTGGVKLKDVDANGNATQYCYAAGASCTGTADPWWRIISITDPLSNQVLKTYTATSYESSLEFNSSTSIQNTILTTDGYGRQVSSQRQQGVGSSNYDTVTSSYLQNTGNSDFGVYRTVPCTATVGGTCSSNFSTFYDMLGRVVYASDAGGGTNTITYSQNDVLSSVGPAPSGENAKQVQNEFDGLGRLTKSCQISSTASGNVSCGENTGSSNGILTISAYTSAVGSQSVTSTRGVQSRSVTVDGLGRPTQKVTPEGGTWTYTYDSNSSCPSGYRGVWGQLASVADPNGNLLCYKYDALNRVTGINADTTTCRHFYYDTSYGTVPSGVTTPVNTNGRLAEASTDNCTGTLITDEWFSYDKDGRVTDQYESTPNSGTYYHSIATYTGPVITAVQLANPSLYTGTYLLDGEGRWSEFKSANTYYLSGTTYNAASQPLTINTNTIGTDYDSYTYDSTTGRMTGWNFTVNSASETGGLTWNSNSTLEELQISDGFNSGGSQKCFYNSTVVTGSGYDDLGRLTGVGCGTASPWTSTWNQGYSYDQYDNLTKSSTGYVNWNPPYCATNNHYTCTPGSYDSDGNVTNDGTNTYHWNEFAKMSSVNGTGTNCSTGGDCNVYDAFGRIVETDPHGGTKSEIWYTQVGKVIMNASTVVQAYWPTPGGGKEVITMSNGGSPYYLHKDWLGNGRIVSELGVRTITADMAYAPYGEVYNIYGSTNTEYQGFNGDSTQDVFAGMYETPNRQLQGSQQGRWLSPDPAGAGWNQYAYATNPNSLVDPSGLGTCAVGIACMGTPLHSNPQMPNGFNFGANIWLAGTASGWVVVGGTVGADQANGTLLGSGAVVGPDGLVANVTTSSIDTLDGELVGGTLQSGDLTLQPAPFAPWLTDLPINNVSGQIFAAVSISGSLFSIAEEGWTALAANGADAVPTSVPTYVIGSGGELSYLSTDGYNVLNIAGWTPEINAAWVTSGAMQGATFLLADEPIGANMFSSAYGLTMYATEMNQLNGVGYITVGNTMVPTLTLGQGAGATLTLGDRSESAEEP